MTKKSILQNIVVGLIFVCLTVSANFAQITTFTYQGKLTDTGTPPANYQMRFELYDAPTAGGQIGPTVTKSSVALSQGVFTTQLDFGAAAFDGSDRFLEIAVRKSDGEVWTILSTRPPIGSAPYSMKSLNASAADSLSAACVGCVQDANIADVSGSKVNGEIPAQSVPTGSGHYIHNSAALQQAAGFNIDGNGVIGDSLGIGIAPRAGIKLDVVGAVLISPTGAGVMQFSNPNSETGMTTIVGTGRADMRFNGTTLKLVAGLVGGPPPLTNGIVIDIQGKVGIGTTPAPGFGRLQVRSSTNDEATLFAENTAGGGNSRLGVYGRSTNGIGVFGQGLNPNGFGVYSDGFLGIRTGFLGNAGNTSLCLNGMTEQIAACSSSLRYKKDFQPFGEGLSFINRLHPIAYKWKGDNMPDIGFGAEDVAKINPLFVTYNTKGEVEGVKYDRLSVVFVNALKEQQAQIEKQQRRIDALTRFICSQNFQAEVCKEQ